MMSNESNDGARHHWKPTAYFDQLMVTYPVTAACVKAEALSCTAHHVKVILALDGDTRPGCHGVHHQRRRSQ
jgi:hypothetical protein